MASSRDRQRKLARAKLDRQLARRAARTRRRRQIQAGVGAAVVLVLIVAGSAWALGAFDDDPKQDTAAEDVCLWTPQDATANTNLKDVGTPATQGLPTSGTRALTVTTNQGAPITAELDLASAPCAGASIAHLASKGFYDNTKCHEITSEGALRCGDPSGTGLGGPTYSFYDENVPVAPEASPSASPAPDQPPAYPKGTVAMVANPPGANGSQFLIFFKDFDPDKPAYPVIGKVTGGLDVVTKIGALQTVDNGSGAKVKPKTDVVIQSLTVGEPTTAPAPAPSGASASPSAG
ncbi:peptidyl-prolyl cis-trans isomerase B (cyclophilin B) [Micromonospora haikouensis]|uniref:Peptidyl-prolyl cis-trans isomerase B (Cyclophilin B) n=1 Tax=Micromonospora haikouensis TaxID=686309 RepID=A0A1C4XBD7_9ACTN|nr:MULTISPECIES: peptidylprolyl isomerase [Micromonospora]MDI5941148.1 peptidylprolyl isomerase [Micromonospora sp. DH15]OON28337.1 peptidylprolyl isomerase [Micromonospora sp. Rc5]SCF05853.1 peptidyl-prolyl cis-trans isomerase B (cyclophilin B) [Micromonospora haikouensis]